jgi:hypothetical protein
MGGTGSWSLAMSAPKNPAPDKRPEPPDPPDAAPCDLPLIIDSNGVQQEAMHCASNEVDRRSLAKLPTKIDPTTCERDYTEEEVVFMQAMHDYKQQHRRPFPHLVGSAGRDQKTGLPQAGSVLKASLLTCEFPSRCRTLGVSRRRRRGVSAALLSAQQIAESLLHLAYHARGRLTHEDWDRIEEAIRRVKQHEWLVHDVHPNLRHRLSEIENRSASAANPTES